MGIIRLGIASVQGIEDIFYVLRSSFNGIRLKLKLDKFRHLEYVLS